MASELSLISPDKSPEKYSIYLLCDGTVRGPIKSSKNFFME